MNPFKNRKAQKVHSFYVEFFTANILLQKLNQ